MSIPAKTAEEAERVRTAARTERAVAGRALSDQYWRQLREGTLLSLGLAAASCALFLTGRSEPVWSALLGVGIVWASFAVSSAVMALVAPRAVDSLILIGMGLYVLKIFVVGAFLLTLGLPAWVEKIPAGGAAVAAVIGWQLVQFRAQRLSRVPLYTQESV